MPITNQQRADWADAAVDAFNRAVSTDPNRVDLYDYPDIVLTDMLADLMHWAEKHRIKWDKVADTASEIYHEEVIEEKLGRKVE